MSEEPKRFKLREEKHVVAEIEIMAWSPTMDLLALANVNGDVLVNRLSWQRVWSLPPPTEGDKVGGFAWRPDGKVIAVGYKSGVLRICDVEKGDLVYVGSVKGGVTCIEWQEQSRHMCEKPERYAEDNSASYLPTAHQLNSLYSDNNLSKDQSGLEAYERFRSLTAQRELNMLMVGTSLSEVNLFSYGAFPTGVIDVSVDDVSGCQHVDSAIISPDLSCLSVVVKSISDGQVSFWNKTYSTSLLLARHEEIRILSSKYVMIASAQMELHVIIQQMCEAWEEILREMDSKLLKFAETKRQGNQGSISNDFLELLLFGTTSLELQSFLLQDLTDKGLKKLGFSIENSYSNIQKLVVRQLQRVSQNITSHLSDLHGMSQWYDKFGVLGLGTATVQKAVKMAGAFAISASELQQVIDTSIKNFKAFFRWLYIAILRLSNENLPPDINKMTQHDIKFVADFLRDNFSHLGEVSDSEEDSELDTSLASVEKPSRQGFKLEKVGQYLKKEDLAQPPNYNENPWVQFLNTTNYKDSQILYPCLHGKSIVQRKDLLDEAIAKAVMEPTTVIGNSMREVMSFPLISASEISQPDLRPPKVCQFTDEEKGVLWTVYVKHQLPCEWMYLMKHTIDMTENSEIEVLRISVGKFMESLEEPLEKPCERHMFVDVAVFNSQTLTLLLQEEHEEDTALLLQLPLALLPAAQFTRAQHIHFNPDMHVETVDVGPLLSKAGVNYQSNAVGHSIAVGGLRTTASMLLRSQRRIRLFLLDDGDGNDDEDEEEEETKDESTQLDDSAADSTKEDVDVTGEDDNKENDMAD
ncbi:anaphase-promoting complex subunit 4-like isoform X2 [Physella acuta]|uniref:anaphase-promoting complex subunit 4-like isoform X2 n=1 Tax=Physella acuta TaxID=109671 RepID=UPI0027DD73F8|nr:anaphase-promoting complex subunit 4-like isoform X2 [Physella acuta]